MFYLFLVMMVSCLTILPDLIFLCIFKLYIPSPTSFYKEKIRISQSVNGMSVQCIRNFVAFEKGREARSYAGAHNGSYCTRLLVCHPPHGCCPGSVSPLRSVTPGRVNPPPRDEGVGVCFRLSSLCFFLPLCETKNSSFFAEATNNRLSGKLVQSPSLLRGLYAP